ncbi:hypothetical protein [Catalinimonas niigatensis]|uniref:hypothetical protein n=1 Tax=Catalinimonas niigatensis TaxID=1397264 RepID=UPI0026650ACE|nr:hypothetical protein [Catalinimonas niigatensis]WPP50503.1 hypothetical protein PZB72_27950 [Catalinimonas niigatensis]
MNKITEGIFFKKNPAPAEDNSNTWKVEWINEHGEKGTYDTQETDLEEAEWKFNYMFDATMKIIKMHKGSLPKKDINE